METHKCPRCCLPKLIIEANWHRKTKSKTGFDLAMCKMCRNKYAQARRDGTWQKRAPRPKVRKPSGFEIACIREKVRYASEPTISIYEEIASPRMADLPVRGS